MRSDHIQPGPQVTVSEPSPYAIAIMHFMSSIQPAGARVWPPMECFVPLMHTGLCSRSASLKMTSISFSLRGKKILSMRVPLKLDMRDTSFTRTPLFFEVCRGWGSGHTASSTSSTKCCCDCSEVIEDISLQQARHCAILQESDVYLSKVSTRSVLGPVRVPRQSKRSLERV